MKFLRILMAAVFCSIDDVFGDTFAAASREFDLQREDVKGNVQSVATQNFSVYKGVLLSRERIASLMKIPTTLSADAFREKFVAKIQRLNEEQRQALLTVCQVRSMSVPVETNMKFSYGSPVFTNFLATNRSAFLANTEPDPNDPETYSALGHAQSVLGLAVTDESGLQLMLSPREVVATRSIGKTGVKGAASSLFDADIDTEDDDFAETTYTVEMLKGLSNDQLKKVMVAYPTSVIKKADGKTDKDATINALVGKAVIA